MSAHQEDEMKKLIFLLLTVVLISGCFGSKKESDSSANKVTTVSKGFVDELKKQYAGKALIVNFFGSWCPPCIKETPDFVEAYEKYKGEDFVIVGISVDKTLEDAQKFVDEHKITYPVFHADSNLGMEMNIYTIPASFIFKPDGSLFDRIEGPLSPTQLEYIATKLK